MQLTQSYSAVFIAIYFNVIYIDCKPVDEIKDRHHIHTDSFGVLELDLDNSIIRQIYEDKLLDKLKNQDNRNNHTENGGRLIVFGQESNVNNQVTNFLSNQINNQLNNQLANGVGDISANQNNMAVVSVAIPQEALQRTVGNAIRNQFFTNGDKTDKDQINQSEKTSLEQNLHIVKEVVGRMQFKHSGLNTERIKFSVPNSVPVLIQLKDKMVVNRKIKKINKEKNGNIENVHIIW